ncbi:hypothetical protein [Corynebacterium hindlerae]|uniref:hypothetical protein n=1 Tax=Corynebacterium hindlerae TaxID=699041 RepID=UPI003AAF50E7
MGDQTSRLIRSWAAQLATALMGVCAVNIKLIDHWLVRPTEGGPIPPLPPQDRGKKDPVEDGMDGLVANAPPQEA